MTDNATGPLVILLNMLKSYRNSTPPGEDSHKPCHNKSFAVCALFNLELMVQTLIRIHTHIHLNV